MLVVGCGKKGNDSSLKDKLQGKSEVKTQEEDPDKDHVNTPENEDKSDKNNKITGDIPRLLHHRGYAYEHNEEGRLTITHHFSFLTLDEKYAGSHKELAACLEDVKDDIIAEEKAKFDKDKKTLSENDDFSFEESWYTYMRRADSRILSFVTEYTATGQFDEEYYTEYSAHNYYVDNGKEIKLSDVVADENAFFDILAGKLKDYYDYAKQNIYYIDAETDEETLKEDVKDHMRSGRCVWTIDPQGVTVFLNSYTGLPSAVSATVLFSEDNESKIFNKGFFEDSKDEWIMQIPEHVGSYYDFEDDGKAEYIHIFATEEMQKYEGSEEHYISGLGINREGNFKSFSTRMTGGTDYYDAFLIHKDHKTCLLECHDEYDTAFINTYVIDKEEIREADAIRAKFETSDEDYDNETENYIPCYIPTDMSKIRVLVEEDNEARDMTSDILSVDPDGKMELKYGEYEHVSLGVNEAVDEANNYTGEEIEPFYGLWIGAFKDKDAAEKLVSKLKDQGLDAYYIYSPEWENLSKEPNYCVTIGESGSEPEAQAYIPDAAKAGYKDAYVKYTGDRLSHRIYYYLYSEETIDISPDEVILNNVQIEDLSGGESMETTLIVDKNTVFDKTCDMQFFGNYRQGDTVLDWFNYNKELMDTDIDKYMEMGPALKGVFEVSVTGNHVDSFYGCYWWD